jgi:hypothetical protein
LLSKIGWSGGKTMPEEKYCLGIKNVIITDKTIAIVGKNINRFLFVCMNFITCKDSSFCSFCDNIALFEK